MESTEDAAYAVCIVMIRKNPVSAVAIITGNILYFIAQESF